VPFHQVVAQENLQSGGRHHKSEQKEQAEEEQREKLRACNAIPFFFNRISTLKCTQRLINKQ
jgi:hypothetical protein